MSEGFKRTVLAALLCIITEISYTQGFSQNGWMIETPSRLTGREGKTTVLISARNDLVPVSGKKGDSATLPCAFNPPEWLSQSVTVLWMKESPDKESTILNQTRFLRAGSHYIDSVTVNEGQRYELIGNLTQGDASIRMRDLWLNDSSDYFCRVHVRIDNQENVTQDVLRLQVDAPATILELSAVRENGTGTVIVCRVVGEPFANITWVDDKGSPVHRGTTVTREPGRHQTLGKLRNPALRGTYSCVAENKHGRDSRQIDFPSTDSNYSNFIVGMLCLIPLIKFLLLLVTGIILFMKIKD
ncbi:sialic acid-binding Ig-like lectin 15 isoform X2 [Rhincodon typus]|uniref:sialic acid-binding Ig-like lectin 15 isoform X2 n=1 Tax=Rhincodon typus TaxID=259920 RepID=UPI00202E5CE5|nr:sialic acid-binding Ig-like lectin 15 isoform X2 [Rhincodon typus]